MSCCGFLCFSLSASCGRGSLRERRRESRLLNLENLQDEADKTITSREEESLHVHKECNDTSLPEFWLDMCHNIPTNASDYLNLNLNPERWTGYNGSHVWKAIYEENCFEKLGDFDEMCYEERVLYRLLSGLHASTNIHISLEYFPPSKSAGRKNWEPNPERFIAQVANSKPRGAHRTSALHPEPWALRPQVPRFSSCIFNNLPTPQPHILCTACTPKRPSAPNPEHLNPKRAVRLAPRASEESSLCVCRGSASCPQSCPLPVQLPLQRGRQFRR